MEIWNVREKSGSFEVDDKWQPCIHFNPITLKEAKIVCNFGPISVNNILFRHTDTYRIYMNNLHTQMYITVIWMGYRSKSVTFLNLFPVWVQ